MLLNLLTPHRTIVANEKVDEIFAPGFKGQLNIFDQHANFLSPLETGILRWRVGNKWTGATISTGILEVFGGAVSIMADVSELQEEINVDRAKGAAEKARKKIDDGGLDDVNFRKYELKLKRAMARQSLGSGN
jgi:F-type H+-transporting ATPase subunit epsilon